ncbi:hypothetical protein I4U23_015598 [Adineta vaga]|nr:hypothetical protein I4U23_015598 [Adineta vaga]
MTNGIVTKNEYCVRPTNDTHISTTDFINTRDENYTFDQLLLMNITANDIFIWSASIDLAEHYQYYLDQQNKSLQSYPLFYNCTSPWFGFRCQYSPYINEHEFTSPSSEHTCYILLECDRGGASLCLDWREICDGRIDCLNDGVDEKHCFELEINECKTNEYRCYNGQCIPEYYRTSEEPTATCLDQSDLREISVCPNLDPTLNSFQCEENTCPPGQNHFSCGDGQCVDDFDECINGRHIMLFESLAIQGNLSYHCWLAMVCLTQLIQQINQTLCHDEFFQFPNIRSYLHSCDDLIQFPLNPVLLSHVHFLYRPKRISTVNTHSILLPDYICYNVQLCSYLSPTFIDKSHTCRSFYQMGLKSSVEYHSWKQIIDIIKPYFHGCTSRYIDHDYSKHTSLYQCRNSSKYISTRRIADNIIDCYLHDDEEDFKLSCSLNEPNRFTCPNESRCRSSILQLHGCEFEESEVKTIDNTVFNQICDKTIDTSPEIINGQNYTDESDCEYWPCNNIYTRCDGFWDCENGKDEEKCRPSNCSHRFLECTSPYNYTMICIPAHEVRNGIVDCLGGIDEPQLCRVADFFSGISYSFRCLNDARCIEPFILCDLHNEIYYTDVCEEWTDYNLTEVQDILCRFGTMSRVPFTLESSETCPLVENNIITSADDAPQKFSHVYTPSWQCTRGSPMRLWLGNENDTTICLCPPNYYGNQCQYQNQRVSLTLILSAIIRYHTFAIFIKLIDDDNDQQQIQSYEQIIYIAKITCGQPFDKYLPYSTRPKHLSKNYSIHIDVYDKVSVEYLASWYFKVPFNFLPVNRLAVLLTLGSNHIAYSGLCSLQCQHGICVKYINEEKFFCQCQKGWTGAQCHISIDCDDCSSDSICIDRAHNRSICICPLEKFGNRCLLKHSCPINYCENNGVCVVTDERMVDTSYECLCPEEFRGERCESPTSRLHITLNDRKISSYLIAFIYSNIPWEPPIAHETILRKITTLQRNVTFYLQQVFQMVFILTNNNYYLTVLQQSETSNISTTIDSTRRCPSVNELLDSKQIKLLRIQRIKYYHTLCQNNPHLKCFFDESYMCLCTTEHHANCFAFDHQHDFQCKENVHCLNDGQCLQDHPICPLTTICNCIDCFFGNQCQFYAKGIGLTLDDLFRYEIRSNIRLSNQSEMVKLSMFFTMILFVIGLVNSILSLITFSRRDTRVVGCGIYLLMLSITSLITITVLMMKFWFVLLSQMNLETNRAVLRFGCLSIEPLLKFCSWMNNWLNACVSIERAINTSKGISFNKTHSIKAARCIVIVLVLLLIGSNIYECFSRDLFDDTEEDRVWCVTLYSSNLYIYTTAISFLHVLGPFFINIFSSLFIIYTIVRRKAAARKYKGRRQHLREQVYQHKPLLIGPLLLVIFTLPFIIISSLFRCELNNEKGYIAEEK